MGRLIRLSQLFGRNGRTGAAALLGGASLVFTPTTANGQVLGAPPPEAKGVVTAPTAAGDAPKIDQKLDGTTVTLSAGGMLSTGNSRQFATTGNGAFETRFSGNSIGVSLLGNYGEGAPPGQPVKVTTQNVQGRVRYDRYVIQQATFFLINTGRHDKLQGLAVRYNLDPGFKYLFWQEPAGAVWGEGGYDLQYDVRRDDARIVLDANKAPVIDPVTGQQVLLDKTALDHSARVFAGFRYAFNKEVTLTTGVEYLQSFVDSTRFRLNFDAVFAAKVSGGLSVGVGFSGRYDHAPLPGKREFDSATTLNLIYAFSDVSEPPKPPPTPTCPCPPPAPTCCPCPPATDPLVPAPASAAPTGAAPVGASATNAASGTAASGSTAAPSTPTPFGTPASPSDAAAKSGNAAPSTPNPPLTR